VRKWMVLCAVFGMLGCAESRQYFRPTEHVYGETTRGEPEAIYDMVGPFGPFGEAKVWSRGAFRDGNDTVVFATIDLHNTSGVPILVNPQRIRLDPVRIGPELLHGLTPTQTQVLSVAPGAFGSIKLRFLLPESVVPGQVSSFGLRWEVKNGPQTYAQRTPFLETRGGNAYAGYPPAGYGYGYGGYGYGGLGYGGYGYYGCTWGDPLCRGGYYGGYGGGFGGRFGGPAPATRGGMEHIRVR
jgi:hypothetical protein